MYLQNVFMVVDEGRMSYEDNLNTKCQTALHAGFTGVVGVISLLGF